MAVLIFFAILSAVTYTAPAEASIPGWYLGPVHGNCNAACQSRSLICEASDFHDHNVEIDSNDKMQNVLLSLGRSCVSFNNNWGSAADVPAISDDSTCFPSASGRDLSSVSCSSNSNQPLSQNKQRLCYCSAATPAATTTPAACATEICIKSGGCTVTSDGHCLLSPNYPSNYPDNADCHAKVMIINN